MIRRRPRAAASVAAFLLLLAAACQKHHFAPPDREQRIVDADTLFATVSFDTIAWESDSARVINGNIVYAATCGRCHGPRGTGGTDYARNRQLDVPSLVEPDATFDGDVAAVRHHIFVGHSGGMPTFGVATLTLREIDAVAWYLIHVLRPEMLGARTR
jgi:mono/diheme cytochrome c family protein